VSIELIVLDVDGTMTNGQITYTESGEELKSFCVKDGLAIASWLKLGKHVAIITGRKSNIVERRAMELGIEHFYQGVHQKQEVLVKILDELDLHWENVAVIGDDLNDSGMLRSAGVSFAPADASSYITRMVDEVLFCNGGEGAVREMIERLILQEGLEEDFLTLWHYE